MRALVIGRFLAELGTSAAFAALVLSLKADGASPSVLGLVLAATVVADALVTPLAGIAGDRLDRRRVMLISDAVAAGLYAALALAHGVPTIAALAVAATVAESFFFPSSGALVAVIHRDHDLARVSARLTQATSLGSVVGPLVAVAAVTLGTPRLAFGINALSFIASCLVTLTLPRTQDAVPPHDESPSTSTWDVRGVFRAYPAVTGFMAMWILIQLGTGGLWVVIPELATSLGQGGSTYATWLAVGAVGTFAGASLVRWASSTGVGRGQIVTAVCTQGAAVALMTVGRTAVGVAALFAVFRAAQAVSGARAYALMHESVPDDVRARASSWIDTATIAAFAAGIALAGPVVEVLGASASLLLTSGLVLLGSVAVPRAPRVPVG